MPLGLVATGLIAELAGEQPCFYYSKLGCQWITDLWGKHQSAFNDCVCEILMVQGKEKHRTKNNKYSIIHVRETQIMPGFVVVVFVCCKF